MNYLFFDIECANCFDDSGKICEFGYVKCDENFKILEQNNLLINPNAPFDWYVLKKLLAYKKEVYMQSKKYDEYYDKIASLFNEENIVIIGHTTNADARYLNDEAKRYKKPFFNYKFHDVATIAKEYFENEHRLKLEELANELNVPKAKHIHRALDDAIMTYGVAVKLCEVSKMSLSSLLNEYKELMGETKDGEVILIDGKTPSESSQGNGMKKGKKHYDEFIKFTKEVKPEGEVIKSILNDKVLCISENYEKNHFKEMMKIVQLMKNYGADYNPSLEECNMFVTFDKIDEEGKLKRCRRLEISRRLNNEGHKIEFISLDELLKIFNKNQENLL